MGAAGRTGVAAPRPAVAWATTCAAALLALAVRWHLVGGASALRGYHGYDDGVYFASAVALVHGRLPYRDFLLLHPPGITLALAPFAALARWTSDSTGLAAARLAFILVGAVSTVLVARLARRWGTAALVVGARVSALGGGAARAERLTLLEPLGTLTLLAGVSLLLRARAPGSSRSWLWAGGAVLGLGPVVKIWNVVPVVVVVAWQACSWSRRSALRVTGAALASAAVVVLPFAVRAPDAMLRLVVLDQLGRPRTPGTLVTRLEGVTGVGTALWHASDVTRGVVTVAVCVVVALAATAAWRHDRGRLWVTLLTAQVGVILVAPSYYAHYAAYSAAAVALVLAAGVSLVDVRHRAWSAALVCCALGLVTGAAVARTPAPVSFPVAQVRERLPATGCIRADSPGALAVVDVLSRNEARGCDTRIDVSGQAYDVGTRDQEGRHVPRVRNHRWQHDAVAYLTSGSAAVVARSTGNGFSDATLRGLLTRSRVVPLGDVQVLLPRPARRSAPPQVP
ncbi:hypothetical protein LJN56_00830 [Cellulomonas sp. zg-Y908]|nr:hypothetical protein [Cellulomonas wangsupingiae]